jgi:hypothetical protein
VPSVFSPPPHTSSYSSQEHTDDHDDDEDDEDDNDASDAGSNASGDASDEEDDASVVKVTKGMKSLNTPYHIRIRDITAYTIQEFPLWFTCKESKKSPLCTLHIVNPSSSTSINLNMTRIGCTDITHIDADDLNEMDTDTLDEIILNIDKSFTSSRHEHFGYTIQNLLDAAATA